MVKLKFSKPKTVLVFILIVVCNCCTTKKHNVVPCNSYPVITNEILQKNIIEYVDNYNSKEVEELRNIVSVKKTIIGDTVSYMIANACICDFLWDKTVNLMTKVENIYVGYYDNQMTDVRMSVEGVVAFMVGDYPFLNRAYEEYKKRKKNFPDDYGYQAAAFCGWILEGEACILKFVDDKLVEKIIFSQIASSKTIIEKYE
jgi:hypothetical protein